MLFVKELFLKFASLRQYGFLGKLPNFSEQLFQSTHADNNFCIVSFIKFV